MKGIFLFIGLVALLAAPPVTASAEVVKVERAFSGLLTAESHPWKVQQCLTEGKQVSTAFTISDLYLGVNRKKGPIVRRPIGSSVTQDAISELSLPGLGGRIKLLFRWGGQGSNGRINFRLRLGNHRTRTMSEAVSSTAKLTFPLSSNQTIPLRMDFYLYDEGSLICVTRLRGDVTQAS